MIARDKPIPPFFKGKTLILGKYSGERYQAVINAAHYLRQVGLDPYPHPNKSPIPFPGNGDPFYFFDQSEIAHRRPHEVELGFLRRLKQHHPRKDMLYVAVAEDGYLGQSATMEVAFAMAHKKKMAFSRRPTHFSERIHKDTLAIVTKHLDRYPVLAPEDIPAHYTAVLKSTINYPALSKRERKAVFHAVLHDIRELKDNF